MAEVICCFVSGDEALATEEDEDGREKIAAGSSIATKAISDPHGGVDMISENAQPCRCDDMKGEFGLRLVLKNRVVFPDIPVKYGIAGGKKTEDVKQKYSPHQWTK